MTERGASRPSDFDPKVIVLDERRVASNTPGPMGLKGAGGGGTFDGMEGRVASLEAHMLNVRENVGLIRTDVRQAATDINAIKLDLGKLETKVSNLPTKEWGVNALIKFAAVISAVTVLSTLATIFVPRLLPSAPAVAPPPAAATIQQK